MDIGISEIVPVIASGTTQYLATYSPLFLLVGGIILAIGIVAVLISFLTRRKVDVFDTDDDIL